ncbi:MAG TPA: glycosyltransferase family 2 protein [Methylomirabilota bacterium]|nr:glycosyltransferase family 2 protein [Methylomirabilota bacterium]
MTDTTIVVVSYDTRDLALAALAAARAAAGPHTAVVAVDNGSADGTPEAVRAAFSDVAVLVNPDNPGYGAAINRAAAARPAAYLCAMNADVILEPGCLPTLRRFLETHPDHGLAGPALVYPGGAPQASCKRFPTLGVALGELFGVHSLAPRNRWQRRFYCEDLDLAREATVDTVSGAVLLIRGDAFRRIGGFDPAFRMYFEEIDLCRRLRDAGLRVGFCPAARAVHHHGASTVQTSVRQVAYYLSYVRYFAKHHGPAAAAALRAAVALSTLGRMAALPLKYPPLDRRRAALLVAKEGACARLLRGLGAPAATRA